MLQVLYSLPELDGAIDTIPLGGLVRDDIYLIPERVMRLAARIRKWGNRHSGFVGCAFLAG
jgi:magnesium chelatase subunit H